MEYTIVKNGVVDNVIDADEAFIIANYSNDIVVEGRYPAGYLFQEGYFISPTKIAVDVNTIVATASYMNPAITVITVAAMKSRIFAEEFDAIQASPDIYVKKIWDDLGSSLYIDLNDTRFIQGVSYILANLANVPNVLDVNIMTVPDVYVRLNELINNGTELERYNGVL